MIYDPEKNQRLGVPISRDVGTWFALAAVLTLILLGLWYAGAFGLR